MFSGIIEASSNLIPGPNLSLQDSKLELNSETQILRFKIKRPDSFDDIKIGDSIAVNGICLTIESFDQSSMQFALGFETLRVIGSSLSSWLNRPFNLERSIRFGDRIHGHLVSGHVDHFAKVAVSEALGDNWILTISVTVDAALTKGIRYLWQKGAIAINGVSLTINSCEQSAENGVPQIHVSVCLIPETIKRTNLSLLAAGDTVAIEYDYLAKAFLGQRSIYGGQIDAP